MPDPSPDANLAESLSRWTLAFGWRDRAAFLCGDDVFTHGEVHRGAGRAAGFLRACGVRPGDRVVIALPGTMEFVWAFLGTVRVGALALIADPEASMLPPGEVAVCAPGRHANVITPGELVTGMARATAPPAHPVHPGTPAFAQFSEVYAHGDPEVSFLAMEPFGLRENDVLFSVPKTHDPVGLRNTVFLPLYSGASAVLDSGRRSITAVAERVRRHRASVLLSTSAFLTRLAAEAPREPFWPLRIAVAQGAPPPVHAEDRLGCPVLAPVQDPAPA
ncbi:AMP-binding protein [Actinoallomurus spadix]|uniref:AMP-dependent synthetase/ligase domain-containing protein n=1 Tax=Actinoallomurus spadix TaxID=79912 RepID=A0ABN0XTE3_9ACTN|nr:AMP-binding protein [Actinoallomurus spadix]MCO5991145.1 AMP-binding protein [Actinoallomurus spadix]